MPSHANKKGRRYRYYVSRGLIRGRRRTVSRGRRVPAGDIEGLVEDRLRQFLASEMEMFDATESLVTDVTQRTDIVARAADLAGRRPKLAPTEKRTILMSLVERIGFLHATLEIRILPGRLLSVLGEEDAPWDWRRRPEATEPTITFTVPARLRRTGKETRLLIDGAGGGGMA